MNDITVVVEQQSTISTQDKAIELVSLEQSSEANVVAIDNADTIFVEGNGLSAVIEDQPDIVIVSLSEQGVPGRDGTNGSGALEFNFAFGDATPEPLLIVPAGKLIYRVGLHIKEPFDGVGASVTVGDVSDPDRLMSAEQSDLTQLGSNEASPGYTYAVATQLTLSIAPGASASSGSGLLTLYIEQ